MSIQNPGLHGVISSNNSTSTPLAGAGQFTGAAEQNDFPDVMVTCKTDQDGTLYVEFSVDGANFDTSVPYSISAEVGEFHVVLKGLTIVTTGADDLTVVYI